MSQKAMKQEFFEIKDSSLLRKKIVRQDRYEVPPATAYIHTESSKYEILNITPFGVALIVKETDKEKILSKEIIRDCEFLHLNQSLQTIHLRPTRSEKHPQSVFNDWIIGCEVVGDPINIDKILIIETLSEVAKKQLELIQVSSEIPENFKVLVLEMKNWLIELKSKIDTLEEKTPTHNSFEEQIYNKTCIDYIGHFLGQVVPQTYAKIPNLIENLNFEQKTKCTHYLRKHIGPLIYGSPFANRAYFKPRGYAGDYEMMNQLYRDAGEGSSLYDKCVHRYFIDEPAGQAVKNRGKFLMNKILELPKMYPDKKVFKVLSVASGPAMEVQLFLEKRTFPKDIKYEFYFIDQDEESLKHAQKNILSIERFVKSGYSFNFENLAIKNIIARGLPDKNFDLIYSAGLFDYFTEPVATAAATKFTNSLSADGYSIIGNFSKDNPCSIFMELALDWQLIYRSPDDLKRIFSPACRSVTIEQEELGINLFAILKK